MNTLAQRLTNFMKTKGLNANKLTNDAGLSIGLINKAINNNKGLSSDTIEKILYAYPDLNATWLISGKGQMLIDNSQNQEKSSIIKDITIDDLNNELQFLKAQNTEILNLLNRAFLKDLIESEEERVAKEKHKES